MRNGYPMIKYRGKANEKVYRFIINFDAFVKYSRRLREHGTDSGRNDSCCC